MTPRWFLVCAIIIVILIVGVPLFLHFEVQSSPGSPVQLSAVEVRSYQGNDLSSINDFHENSIAGPQHINESDYRLMITGLTMTTRVLTYPEILASQQHYAKVVTLNCVEGWSVKLLWEGGWSAISSGKPASIPVRTPSSLLHMIRTLPHSLFPT